MDIFVFRGRGSYEFKKSEEEEDPELRPPQRSAVQVY